MIKYAATIVSAYVEDKSTKKVLMKQTLPGYSLLGGNVDFSIGFPGCLVDSIKKTHNILIKPESVIGIYQHIANEGPNEYLIQNIAVSCSYDGGNCTSGLEILSVDELARSKFPFRTKETHSILADAKQGVTYPLGIVCLTDQMTAKTSTKKFEPANSITLENYILSVCSAVIHDSHGNYLLMESNRPESKGKFSLIGGKIEKGITFIDSLLSEVKEESGLDLKPEGILCAYVNYIPEISRHVTNLAVLMEPINKQNISVPNGKEDEVRSLRWFSLSGIGDIGLFRTKDTVEALMAAEMVRLGAARLLPIELVKDV